MPTLPEVTFHIYPTDCDMLGHLNHATMLNFLERARWSLLEPQIDIRNWAKQPVFSVVRHVDIGYLAQSLPGEEEPVLAALERVLRQLGENDELGQVLAREAELADDPARRADFLAALGTLRLEALDGQARITSHGRQLEKLGMHPRLAHMLVKSRDIGATHLACDLAAVLSERDILRAGQTARDAEALDFGFGFGGEYETSGAISQAASLPSASFSACSGASTSSMRPAR